MRMNLLVDLLERVFLPLVGLPHGGTGCRPPEVRPSPPPCGCSARVIETPRLLGFWPHRRRRRRRKLGRGAWLFVYQREKGGRFGLFSRPRHGRRHVRLGPLEFDDRIAPLVAAAEKAPAQAAGVFTTAAGLLAFGQRL